MNRFYIGDRELEPPDMPDEEDSQVTEQQQFDELEPDEVAE